MNISAVTYKTAPYLAQPSYARRAAEQPDNAAAPAREKENNQGLSEEEQKQVEQLKARDREVRMHEQAHLAAAGGLAVSGASYSYQRGPDGVNYAIGGEVKIDTSPGDTPEETLQRARNIRAAAVAPAEPSSQDRAVAARASQMEVEARAELAAQAGQGDESGQGTTASAENTGLTRDSSPQQQGRSLLVRHYEKDSEYELGAQLSIQA